MIQIDVSEAIKRYEAGESIAELARSLGVSRPTVRSRLLVAGAKLRWVSVVVVRDDLLPVLNETLDGLLLGDGHLCVPKGGITPWYIMRQSLTQAGWVTQIQKYLESVGIYCRRRRETLDLTNSKLPELKATTSEIDILATRACASFRDSHRRWYRSRVKIVPHDLTITPRTLAHWYWGDGSFSRRKGTSRAVVSFRTDCFHLTEVNRLRDLLYATYGWQLRVNLNHRKNGYSLIMNRQADVQDLINIVRPLAPSCFAYKLGEGKKLKPTRRT